MHVYMSVCVIVLPGAFGSGGASFSRTASGLCARKYYYCYYHYHYCYYDYDAYNYT